MLNCLWFRFPHLWRVNVAISPWEGKLVNPAYRAIITGHASLLWNGPSWHQQNGESLRNHFDRLHQLTFWGVTWSAGKKLMNWKSESLGKAAVTCGLRKCCLPEPQTPSHIPGVRAHSQISMLQTVPAAWPVEWRSRITLCNELPSWFLESAIRGKQSLVNVRISSSLYQIPLFFLPIQMLGSWLCLGATMA